MPSIKIYPPTPLEDRGVTETRFNIWIEELEVYLSQEKPYSVFLTGEKYQTWESLETNPNRIQNLDDDDVVRPGNRNGRDIPQNEC